MPHVFILPLVIIATFHRTPTTLLCAFEAQRIVDKITFSATIKLSVFENNDHRIVKNGIGCYQEGKLAYYMTLD